MIPFPNHIEVPRYPNTAIAGEISAPADVGTSTEVYFILLIHILIFFSSLFTNICHPMLNLLPKGKFIVQINSCNTLTIQRRRCRCRRRRCGQGCTRRAQVKRYKNRFLYFRSNYSRIDFNQGNKIPSPPLPLYIPVPFLF